MDQSSYAIEITDVSKRYKLFNTKTERIKEAFHPLKKKYHQDFYALKDINLKVSKGEVLGIVGMNGSGKSTLLTIIAGISQPTAGTVRVSGNVVPMLELGSGFNPEFTGLENIYFYNNLLGLTNKQTDVILDDILAFAEIGAFINQPVKNYSSGMKARLAFAVSVNIDPDILIIDEVLAVGDELFRRKSFAKIEEFFRAGKTILFVSHVVQNVNQLCSRAIMLHNGQIVLDGPTKFVTMNYQKFIFSKPAEQISLIQEFEQLTPSGTFLPSDSALEHPENVHNRSVLGRESNNCDFTEYYVENYLPKSTVITKNADIDIQNIRIVTDEGKKVNHLVPGRKYTILYDVHFNEEVAPVNFGIGIHTEQGVPVTWKIFPGSKLFMPIDRLVSDWRTVKWTFCCTLIPDVYFLGMALRIQGHEGPSVIFKGSDIFAFKVQGYKDVDIGGYFDAAFQVEVF